MADIKTTVAHSRDVKDAALNLNVKAHEVRRTLAAVWSLQSTHVKPPSPESTFSLDMKNESSESVVGDDDRVLVDKSDFAPGGKYRSIVKLFIHYEFQTPGMWAMATGWLVKPDIFVTAGHCSYDWGHKLGRATEVKAYIGYDGHQSEKEPDVQFRSVKKIVTTEGWVKSKGHKAFDVSFMQVDAPFTEITPVRFEETPSSGSLTLGVVGYPADLPDKKTGEKGAHMYEMFLSTEFDLSTQADTMLEYQIDTFGGNSGSPVLRDDLVSIGAHVYGGTLNSASVIGKYGNPYGDYLAAFGLPLSNDGLNLIPVPRTEAISAPVPSGYGPSAPITPAIKIPTPSVQARSQQQRRSSLTKLVQNDKTGQGQNPHVKSQSTEADEEGFMDVLRTVAKALPVGLGVVGGPIGALAGFALNVAGAAITAKTAAESSIDDAPAIHEGSMERAILAEATLSTLQSIELPSGLEESIFSDMRDTVMKALPIVRKAAPHVMGAMMEPALRIALDSLHNYNQKGAAAGAESFEIERTESFQSFFSSLARPTGPFGPHVRYSSAIDMPADHQAEEFLRYLQPSLQRKLQESAIDGATEESFMDVLKAGVRIAGKGVFVASKFGLPLLVDAIKQSGGAEAFEEQPSSSGPAAHLLAADPLAQRALVADAALKAVMMIPPQHLEEEGFFGFLGDVIKRVVPIAMKVAPVVVGAINPTIGKMVKGVLNQESALADDESANVGGTSGSSRRRAGGQNLSTKGGLHSLRYSSAPFVGDGGRDRFDRPESKTRLPALLFNKQLT